MIDGTLLFAGTTVYSPWFPRQADMLRVTAECIARSNASVRIDLYTKNQEEPGDGDPVYSSTYIELGDDIRPTVEWKTESTGDGVEQLLRFKYTVTSESSNDWILFRLLPAVWFDAVNATLP